MKSLKLIALSLTLVAALAATGCGGGSDRQGGTMPTPTPTPTPTPSSVGFTDWSKSAVFAGMADGTPVNMDSLTFNFDNDDNPSAYSDLLPM